MPKFLLFRERIFPKLRVLVTPLSKRKIQRIPRYNFSRGLAEMNVRINMLKQRLKPVIVGIGGETGAGKTHLAQQIRASVLNIDDYYRGRSHVSIEDWDRPRGLDLSLLRKHLRELKKGRPIKKPVYDFKKGERAGHVDFAPSDVIVVEGLYALHRKIAPFCDLRVYVESSKGVMRARAIARDSKEKDRPREFVEKQVTTIVEPLGQVYVVPSKKRADMIITT